MFHIFKEEYHGRKNRNYEGKDEKKISEISNKINEATHTFEKQEGDEGTDAKWTWSFW